MRGSWFLPFRAFTAVCEINNTLKIIYKKKVKKESLKSDSIYKSRGKFIVLT